MRPIQKPIVFTLLLATFFLSSCKKERSCENCNDNNTTDANKPPVARAGRDQTTVLPTDSIILDGSASTDPEGKISSYSWIKISGPFPSHISDPDSTKTHVITLVVGVYHFELTVNDHEGLSAKDTVRVTVLETVANTQCGSNRPQVIARLIPIGRLSQARPGMAVAAAGNKIVFAGGGYQYNTPRSSRVDIYDIPSQSWSRAELSKARNGIAAIAAGNKLFFAGGDVSDGSYPVDTVDIYDVATNTWTVTHLSIAGHSIAAAALGNRVFFAGGNGGFTGPGREKNVDIYDLTTSSWSTASLSEMKGVGVSAVTLNNKVYFAGGETWMPNEVYWYASKYIDVYDQAANAWSIASLSEGKMALAGIAVDDKIYWAGGYTGTGHTSTSYHTSCLVEIMDVNTGSSRLDYLSGPASWWIDGSYNAVLKDHKIVFLGSERSDQMKFDIYDVATDTWSVGVLPINIKEASIISVNNIIYIAGGLVNNVLSDQVWQLEF